MKKITALVLLTFSMSVFSQTTNNYTSVKNGDDSYTITNNTNPLDSRTVRKTATGWQTMDDLNPLNSTDHTVDALGNVQNQDTFNPLNSSTTRKTGVNQWEITDDFNPLNSTTVDKFGNTYHFRETYPGSNRTSTSRTPIKVVSPNYVGDAETQRQTAEAYAAGGAALGAGIAAYASNRSPMSQRNGNRGWGINAGYNDGLLFGTEFYFNKISFGLLYTWETNETDRIYEYTNTFAGSLGVKLSDNLYIKGYYGATSGEYEDFGDFDSCRSLHGIAVICDGEESYFIDEAFAGVGIQWFLKRHQVAWTPEIMFTSKGIGVGIGLVW